MAKFTSKIPPTNIMENKKFQILDISIVRKKLKILFLPNSHIWFQNNQKWLNLPMDNKHFNYLTKFIK
jgi:hypothetical protein